MKNVKNTIVYALLTNVLFLVFSYLFNLNSNNNFIPAFSFLVLFTFISFIIMRMADKKGDKLSYMPTVFVILALNIVGILLVIFSHRFNLNKLLLIETILLVIAIISFYYNFSYEKNRTRTNNKYEDIEDRFKPKGGSY